MMQFSWVVNHYKASNQEPGIRHQLSYSHGASMGKTVIFRSLIRK